MFRFIVLCLGTLVRFLRARRSLLLENLALRQQLAVLKPRHPSPRIGLLDKLFWVAVRRFWSGWKQSLIVVTPETVVRWHRAGFRFYWWLISRARTQVGRRQTPQEVRELIFWMVVENPTALLPSCSSRFVGAVNGDGNSVLLNGRLPLNATPFTLSAGQVQQGS